MNPRYPTASELRRIKTWPIKTDEDVEALMTFVETIWHFADWGWRRASRRRRQYKQGSLRRRYSLSTGGWSGNEDIITALQANWMFWIMAWESSRRGGHYVFQVPS
jgi:hypothetical protein